MTDHDVEKLARVHPTLHRLFLDVSQRHNIGIAQGARTVEESRHNKETGRSWLKDPRNSEHLLHPDGYAHAFDFFVRNNDGSANWNIAAYDPVVADFKRTAQAWNVGIICGLDWHVRDAGHIQLVAPSRIVFT